MEAKDIRLGKAKLEDWKDLYINIWSRPESARYMLWRVTENEEEAKVRIEKSVAWQEAHEAYTIYEKKSNQAIGFAGMTEIRPHVWEDTGIALGPDYVHKGYGKQVLRLLMERAASLGAAEFICSARSQNTASKALIASCGFSYQYSEPKTDPRDGTPYEVEFYGFTFPQC
ncbi:MAG: GNAT family N-acetyltransferase [Lachnospiraceae bacterium]|nr:GNAT family N-acetyltransferase [Lachnospiraceae bacterium]